MDTDERDIEVGRAFRELTKAEQELTCYERKLEKFIGDMRQLAQSFTQDTEIVRSQNRIVEINGQESDIEFMNAVDFEALVKGIRESKENVKKLNSQLISLTGRDVLNAKKS